MRAPSTSMKRPCGGSAFSTRRAVHAEKRASPQSTSPRPARPTPMIHAKTVIDIPRLPVQKPVLRQGVQDCSLLQSPPEQVPICNGHEALDDRGPFGVGPDQYAHLSVFDATNDRLAPDPTRRA